MGSLLTGLLLLPLGSVLSSVDCALPWFDGRVSLPLLPYAFLSGPEVDTALAMQGLFLLPSCPFLPWCLCWVSCVSVRGLLFFACTSLLLRWASPCSFLCAHFLPSLVLWPCVLCHLFLCFPFCLLAPFPQCWVLWSSCVSSFVAFPVPSCEPGQSASPPVSMYGLYLSASAELLKVPCWPLLLTSQFVRLAVTRSYCSV